MSNSFLERPMVPLAQSIVEESAVGKSDFARVRAKWNAGCESVRFD
jgi:hypothetical protein